MEGANTAERALGAMLDHAIRVHDMAGDETSWQLLARAACVAREPAGITTCKLVDVTLLEDSSVLTERWAERLLRVSELRRRYVDAAVRRQDAQRRAE